MELKQTPYSMEAEQGVIASLIIDYEKIREISDILFPTHFYNHTNKIIYEAILDIYETKNEVDLIILKAYLEDTGKLLEIGGMKYIIDIVEAVDTSEMAKLYANIVYEKFIIRQVISKASNILNYSYEHSSYQDIIDYAEKEIFDLSNLNRSEDFVDWHHLLEETHMDIIKMSSNKNQGLVGLSTGYGELDAITSGFQKSDLIVLAARPAVGKTAFALNVAKNVAKASINENPSVAIFSLEMSAKQLLQRLISMESTIPISDIRGGKISQKDQEKLTFAIDTLSSYNIYVDDTAGIKIGELKQKSRKLKAENGLDFIVIDYLQLITTNNKENRQQEVSEISRELKTLAKELEVPIIALSQLSRGVEHRHDKRPMLSDIRESGAIEQDADIVMMLYRPEYYGIQEDEIEQQPSGYTELIIAKHRNGSTGTLEFNFIKEINKFTQ